MSEYSVDYYVDDSPSDYACRYHHCSFEARHRSRYHVRSASGGVFSLCNDFNTRREKKRMSDPEKIRDIIKRLLADSVTIDKTTTILKGKKRDGVHKAIPSHKIGDYLCHHLQKKRKERSKTITLSKKIIKSLTEVSKGELVDEL